MKYRVKCTHCVSLVLNLYPMIENIDGHEPSEHYIDVYTPEEAILISWLDRYQEGSFQVYNELVKITSNNK